MFGRDKSDPVIYGGAIGMEIKSPFPPDVLAYLRPHEYATPEQLERARAYWPERALSEFEIVETGPEKFSFIDRETGAEYRRDDSAALLDPNPKASDIQCFVVDAGNRIHYLRPRGPRPSASSEVLVQYVRGGQVS